jgi:hypothetical protein
MVLTPEAALIALVVVAVALGVVTANAILGWPHLTSPRRKPG